MTSRIDSSLRPIAPNRTGNAAPSTSAPKPSETPAPAQGWSPTVKVAGAERRTEMRMDGGPASLAAQNEMPIACPVLKALVAEGSVKVDPNGRVKTSEMLDALKDHGMTRPMLEVLRGISYFANAPKDIPKNMLTQSFDVMHLRSGLTMHNSDSNILSQGHFDQAAFDRFTSHAKNGFMDEQAFADAVRANTEGDMKAQNPLVALTFGQNAVLAEYPVLIKLFGTKSPDGKPAIAVDALKAFWKDGVLPQNVAPGSVGVASSAVAYATMLSRVEPKLAGDVLRSIGTATGLAREGERLSTARDAANPTAMAGLGAAKAAKCPYMSGAAKMPAQVPATLDAHLGR